MPTKYTKDDYLTATKYAKKNNENVEDVQKAIKLARLTNAMALIATTRRPIIVPDGQSNHSTLLIRPEPAAQEKFQQLLEQVKKASK